MKRSLLIAALLVFGLNACGEKTAPPPPPAQTAKAPETVTPPPPASPQLQAGPAASTTLVNEPEPPKPAQPPAPPASAGALQAGVHFELIPTPQPTETGKKIEVIEFFWYACPHCKNLQAPLTAWLKKMPADVELRRVPAVLSDSWQQLARTFYTIDAMGLTGKLHHELFAAIHDQRSLDPKVLVRDPKPLFDWVAAKGVDAKKFADTYNSFAVTSRTQRAVDVTRNYDVPYTPVIVVQGRYLMSPSMKGNSNPDGSLNYDKFFQTLDQLIVQVRSKPPAQK